jgi:hypothetical protein
LLKHAEKKFAGNISFLQSLTPEQRVDLFRADVCIFFFLKLDEEGKGRGERNGWVGGGTKKGEGDRGEGGGVHHRTRRERGERRKEWI